MMVSVIVPAFNTEKYIGKMIECVLAQTYTNLQLIFIDDGSTDKTSEIIKQYQGGDSRIEYYYQDNSGVSAARNFGLTKAIGDKVFFFDSDDTFEPNLIEECLSYAHKNDVESVLYGYGNRINGKVKSEHKFELNGTFRGEQIVKDVVPYFLGRSYEDVNRWLRKECGLRDGKEHTALWRIMLDNSVIKNNSLQFDTKLSLGEDTKFINTYLLFTESIGVLQETLYYLTIREGSANVTNNENPALMAKNKEKLIVARKEIDEIAKMRGMYTHEYWQGTVVLSAVQLALGLSHYNNGWKVFKHYMDTKDVQQAIRGFAPYMGSVKSIPFVLLKMRLSWLLYGIFKMLPQKVVKRIL